MPDDTKYTKILDALQTLLEAKDIQHISVSEIARAADMGKGSLYYYFPSKEAIFEALVERDYAAPLETAKNLASRTDVSPFTRMAMIFQACRNSSAQFRSRRNTPASASAPEQAFIHQKYLTYLITELKPVLTEIIRQGIAAGEIILNALPLWQRSCSLSWPSNWTIRWCLPHRKKPKTRSWGLYLFWKKERKIRRLR